MADPKSKARVLVGSHVAERSKPVNLGTNMSPCSRSEFAEKRFVGATLSVWRLGGRPANITEGAVFRRLWLPPSASGDGPPALPVLGTEALTTLRRAAIRYLYRAASCPVPTDDVCGSETLAGIRRGAAK